METIAGANVGVFIPIISHTIHWFNNVRTVIDLLDSVFLANPFLEARRMTAIRNGRQLSLTERLNPWEILTVDYQIYRTAHTESAAATAARSLPVGLHSYFNPPAWNMEPQPATVQPILLTTNQDPDSIKLRFHFREFQVPPFEIWATKGDYIYLSYDQAREYLLSQRCINRRQELSFAWANLSRGPHTHQKIGEVPLPRGQLGFGIIVRRRDESQESADEAPMPSGFLTVRERTTLGPNEQLVTLFRALSEEGGNAVEGSTNSFEDSRNYGDAEERHDRGSHTN
ncbi:hypothetical protein ABW19_dt0200409 [Dactylella cylindrospora]|nr:hypothetical protein ABW19_dt0200409 [Dactylella cylindrospora]